MGKGIWHQVVTVVILRQNMRQTSQTLEDERLRIALTNMRYKACTGVDIKFLNSKISGHPGAPKIEDEVFCNVSIITRLNVHKDEFNRLASKKFADEHSEELMLFYSDDRLPSSETDMLGCTSPL